jgi:hypothetical protein
MNNMEKFNNLLDGIDPVCREKLIMGTSFALSFVSNERRNMGNFSNCIEFSAYYVL